MTTAHILVVEDDKTTRTAIVSQLQFVGYHVTQACNGETALDLIETHTFNVIITDIIMDDIDGIEVLQTARMQPYQPEVILLTGYGSLDTAIVALRQGAFDYLQKPCPTDQLLACIQSAAQRHKAQQKMRQAVSLLSTKLTSDAAAHVEQSPEQEEHLAYQPQPNPATEQAVHLTPALQADPPPSIHIGALTIGPSRADIFFQGKPIQLTQVEYAILSYLATRHGQECPCKAIVQHTHNLETNEEQAQRILRSHISNLRRKFNPEYLVSKRGYGYKLIDPDTHTA